MAGQKAEQRLDGARERCGEAVVVDDRIDHVGQGLELRLGRVVFEPDFDALAGPTSQLGDRALGDDLAGPQDGHSIRGSLDLAQGVRGQKDRRTCRARFPDHAQEFVLHEWIKAVRGLIKDDQLGVEEEREQEGYLAPVAAREVAQMAAQIESKSLGELVTACRIEAAAQPADAGHKVHPG